VNRTLINVVFYQATWFASVIGAAHGWWWSGALVLLLFAGWQLADRRSRQVDLRLVAAALGCGFLIDTSLVLSGSVNFATPVPFDAFAPLWILVLWAAFALTLNHSLAILQEHLWFAAALGAIGAPLAYVAAARSFHAITIDVPEWHAMGLLAGTWALALPLLLVLARRWSRQAAAVQPA
jgi:hypothetical protein